MNIFLQIFVILCFSIVIIALFREKTDFLTYSVVAMLAAATATFLFSPTTISIENLASLMQPTLIHNHLLDR